MFFSCGPEQVVLLGTCLCGLVLSLLLVHGRFSPLRYHAGEVFRHAVHPLWSHPWEFPEARDPLEAASPERCFAASSLAVLRESRSMYVDMAEDVKAREMWWSCHRCARGPGGIWEWLERLRPGAPEKPWGRVLDAGTGPSSVAWLVKAATRLGISSITATTASKDLAASLKRKHSKAVASGLLNLAVVSRWGSVPGTGTNLGLFDTVILDYVLGAVEGLEPHGHAAVLDAISSHAAEGAAVLIVGAEPYEERFSDPAGSSLVGSVMRVRDTCLKAAGVTPFRELPMAETLRLVRQAGLSAVASTAFPVLLSRRGLLHQLPVCQQRLDADTMLSAQFKTAILNEVAQLSNRIKKEVTSDWCAGIDYAIVAKKGI
jgi:hypothetical protein